MLNLDTVYRFLDKLNNKLKDQVNKSVFNTQKILNNDHRVSFFYDMTTLCFEASDEDDLRKTGFSKDGRPANLVNPDRFPNFTGWPKSENKLVSYREFRNTGFYAWCCPNILSAFGNCILYAWSTAILNCWSVKSSFYLHQNRFLRTYHLSKLWCLLLLFLHPFEQKQIV